MQLYQIIFMCLLAAVLSMPNIHQQQVHYPGQLFPYGEEQQQTPISNQRPITFPETLDPHVETSADDYDTEFLDTLYPRDEVHVLPPIDESSVRDIIEEKPDNYSNYNREIETLDDKIDFFESQNSDSNTITYEPAVNSVDEFGPESEGNTYEPAVNSGDEFGQEYEGNGQQKKPETDQIRVVDEFYSPSVTADPPVGSAYDANYKPTFSEKDEQPTEYGSDNKFNSWMTKVFGPGGELETSISKTYQDVTGILKKTSDDIWSSIRTNHPEFYEGLKELKSWFTKSVSEFGLMIQKGAEYMADRCSLVFEGPEASEILHRLEKNLKEGDEAVSKFFDIIGYKISEWSKVKDLQATPFGDPKDQTQQQYSDNFGDASHPDLFKDPEVSSQLDELVLKKIINQEEANLLTQEKI